jgi:hypothetical protein
METFHAKLDHSVVVEAAQLNPENAGELVNWTQGQLIQEYDPRNDEEFVGINIYNITGPVRASQGDYIVKYDGQFYVAKQGRFQATYLPGVPDGG